MPHNAARFELGVAARSTRFLLPVLVCFLSGIHTPSHYSMAYCTAAWALLRPDTAAGIEFERCGFSVEEGRIGMSTDLVFVGCQAGPGDTGNYSKKSCIELASNCSSQLGNIAPEVEIEDRTSWEVGHIEPIHLA